MRLEIGNYVNWYEEYADGIAGKDWGDGIIIETQVYPSSFYTDQLKTYKVFRNKHKDFYWFEERQLKLKEIK
jgi:hypothetical protein